MKAPSPEDAGPRGRGFAAGTLSSHGRAGLAAERAEEQPIWPQQAGDKAGGEPEGAGV